MILNDCAGSEHTPNPYRSLAIENVTYFNKRKELCRITLSLLMGGQGEEGEIINSTPYKNLASELMLVMFLKISNVICSMNSLASVTIHLKSSQISAMFQGLFKNCSLQVR